MACVVFALQHCFDRATIEAAIAKPEEDRLPSELKSLQQRLDELKAEIKQGKRNVLKASDHLRPMLEAELSELIAERDELERRQRNLTVTAGEITAHWWKEFEGKLIGICSADWVDDVPHPGKDGEYVHVKTKRGLQPILLFEPSAFRNLLRNLGFRVTITCHPKGKGNHFVVEIIDITYNEL
jgi:hypothetical protein